MKRKIEIKNLFHHQPYLGWLMITLFCGISIFSILQFYKVFNNTQSIVNNFQTQFDKKIQTSESVIQQILQDKSNTRNLIINDSNNCYIYYENDTAIAWNTNQFNSAIINKSFTNKRTIARIDNQWIYGRKIIIDTLEKKKLLHFIPIAAIDNSFTDPFLIETFENRKFDISIIFDTAGLGHINYLHIGNNEKVAYTITDIKIKNVSYLIDVLFIISIITFLIWIFKLAVYFSNKVHFLIVLVHLYLINIGLLYLIKNGILVPSTLLESDFFNPLLFSSVKGYNNFAQIILESILNFNLVNFALYSISKRRIFSNKKNNNRSFYIISQVCAFLILLYNYNNINKTLIPLVFDSSISFDVENFEQISLFTFWGIFIFVLTYVNFILGLNLIHKLFNNKLVQNNWNLLLLITYCVIISIVFYNNLNIVILASIIGSTVISILFFNKIGTPFGYFLGKNKSNSNSLGFIWIIFIGILSTISIVILNKIKEEQTRISFAEKHTRTKDLVLEYSAEAIANDIANDTFVINAITNVNTSEIKDYLGNKYFFPLFENPNFSIVIYNAKKEIIGSKNPTVNIPLPKTIAENNFAYKYNDDISNPITYVFYYQIKSEDLVLGYIVSFINNEFLFNQIKEKSKFENSFNQNLLAHKYTVGFYNKGVLSQQIGEAQLPNTIPINKYVAPFFDNNIKYSNLIYPIDINSSDYIFIRFERNIVLNFISHFSYSMITILLGWISVNYVWIFFLIPVNTNIKKRQIHLTIKNKINYTIWLIVFISFAVIGTFTYFIFNEKNKSIQYFNLIEQINIARHILINKQISNFNKDELSTTLNNIQKDLNISSEVFSNAGILIENSENINTNKLTGTNLLSIDVLDQINNTSRNIIINDEKINNKHTQVAYAKLGSLNNEISNGILRITQNNNTTNSYIDTNDIYLTLINIYILIFILSTLVASLISNNITKSFNLLIKKFRNVSLKHNETIDWQFKDEIGVLVNEYNLMIRKVEALATKLSQTERENMWREMAQQVAHEIKNPLTPMKLHVQYLDNAIKNNHENLEALTQKVCTIISEQIDQLNHIATEFSNFAKMPKANPEIVNINEVLKMVITLFEKENNTSIIYADPIKSTYAYIDKSFFIRAITNLIKNGIQAIPENKEGIIEIRLANNNAQLVISIKDNGSGIPNNLIDKLFTPNFTTKSSGTGIGLSMVKNIIEHAGGTIKFRTRENEGTIFYITLPVKIINTNRELI